MYAKTLSLITLFLTLQVSAALKDRREKEPLEQFAGNRDSAMLLFGVGPTAMTSILSSEQARLIAPIPEKRDVSYAQLITNLQKTALQELAKRESNKQSVAGAKKKHDLLKQHTQHTKEARINNSRRISAAYSALLPGVARRVSAPDRPPLVAAAALKSKAHSMPPTHVVRLHPRQSAVVSQSLNS